MVVGVYEQKILLQAHEISILLDSTLWVALGQGARPRQPWHHYPDRRRGRRKSGVILVGDCTDPFAVEAVRATMGSLFHVPLARMSKEEFKTFAKDMARNGGRHPPERLR